MSNNLAHNPIIIDTVMTAGYKAGVVASVGSPLGPVQAEKIYWENPQHVGDVVTIVDPQNGSVLLTLRCEVANQSQIVDWTAHPKAWRDFQVSVLGSSTLYIYTL